MEDQVFSRTNYNNNSLRSFPQTAEIEIINCGCCCILVPRASLTIGCLMDINCDWMNERMRCYDVVKISPSKEGVAPYLLELTSSEKASKAVKSWF